MRKSILAVVAFAVLLLSPAASAFAHGTAHHSRKARRTRSARVASVAHTAVVCDLFASPAGSDATGDGSLANPYATVTQLDASLAPGQTGCLRAGTYGSTSTEFDLTNSGTGSGNITITSYPGEQAKLVGFVNIMASYTTLSGLEIDGSNTFYTTERPGTSCPYPVSQGLQINGSHDVFEDNDYFQSVASLRGNGIGIGWNGAADDTIIRYNRIHDVGQCMAYDHLIYLDQGNGTQIYDNWLWNDPHGFGIQVYPQTSGAHIFGNVIAHAGSGFTIGGTSSTSNNEIDNNVVIDSTGLADAGTTGVAIQDWWESTPGTNNTFVHNDSYGNPAGIASVSDVKLSGNIASNPEFVDPAAHDFAIKPGSPAAGWNLWNGVSS